MPSSNKSGSPALPLPRWLTGPARLARFWFGIADRVRPAPYAVSGLSLGLFKYAAEALLIWIYSSKIFWPWDFINPTINARVQLLRSLPEWIPWTIFIWTLPFMWIAVTISVPRMADAGRSPWMGLLVVIPLVNYFFMFWACIEPSSSENLWRPIVQVPNNQDRAKSTASPSAVA